MLDFKNNSYSGWWYASKNSHEPQHYHSGISQGTVLDGEIILICDNEEFRLQKNDGFLLPPQIKHTAEIIVGKEGFLFFGTIVGNTVYEDRNEILNVESYFNMISNYYREQKIDMNHITVNR